METANWVRVGAEHADELGSLRAQVAELEARLAALPIVPAGFYVELDTTVGERGEWVLSEQRGIDRVDIARVYRGDGICDVRKEWLGDILRVHIRCLVALEWAVTNNAKPPHASTGT